MEDKKMNAVTTSDELENHFRTLEYLEGNTDHYLFLWEMDSDRIRLVKGKTTWDFFEDGLKNEYYLDELLRHIYEKDLPMLQKEVKNLKSGVQDTHSMTYRMTDVKSNIVWMNSRGTVIRNSHGRPVAVVGTLSDTTMSGKTDHLTGLPNNICFQEHLEDVLKMQKKGTLFVLGIDNFRNINQKYGREYGNSVLKQFATILEKTVDQKFWVYRLEGDRFAINFIGYSTGEVNYIYHEIKNRVAGICTFSAGAVEYPVDSKQDLNLLINYVESAFSRAKKEGKNRFKVFSPEKYEQRRYYSDLAEEMRQCIQDSFKGFSLHFQPLVGMPDCTLKGAEALLRYHSEKYGNVGAGVAVEIMEQNGLMVEVGYWVLAQAIAACKKWRTFCPDFHMNINLSYVQLEEKELSETIFSLLDKEELPGDAITLELIESMPLQDYDRFNRLFSHWSERGIQIAIDDFGTGYSNFNYLKSLFVDSIKIDREFIQNIHMSAYNYHLLDNMVQMAHSAQISVCCEGVEEKEELMALMPLKSDLIQGYFFGKPISGEEFEENYFHTTHTVSEWACLGADIRVFDEYANVMQNMPAQAVSSQNDMFRRIFDLVDEYVQITDNQTFEMLYMNAAAKRITGINDYVGKKCYQIMYRGTAPCDNCIVYEKDHKGFYIYSKANRYLNKQFLWKGRLIEWQGREARLTIGFDLAELDSRSYETEKMLQIEEHVVEAVSLLFKTEEMGEGIRDFLKYAANYYHADRAYIYIRSQKDRMWKNLYEWCDEQKDTSRMHLIDFSLDTLKEWMPVLTEGQSLVVGQKRSDPQVTAKMRGNLKLQEVDRILVVPMLRDGEVFGFVGVNNAEFLMDDDNFMRKTAPFVSKVFLDHKMTDASNERIAAMTGLLLTENILNATRLGLWIIEVDTNTDTSRMYVDWNMNDVLGVEDTLDSEEYYNHWYNNIHEDYYTYVNTTVQRMMQGGEVFELQYMWNHPTRGEIPVRCVGTLSKYENGVYTLKGYHRMLDDIIRMKYAPNSNQEKMVYDETLQSIYFYTERNMLWGSAIREADFPECWILQEMVHPYFAESFRNLFKNTKAQTDNKRLDVLLKAETNEYKWFRIETWKNGLFAGNDHPMLSVAVYPIPEKENMQLQYLRKEDFYQAVLSTTAAYIELDLNTGKIQKSGGLWEKYSADPSLSFHELVDLYLKDTVIEEDYDEYAKHMSEDWMKETYYRGEHMVSYQFRRRTSDGQYCWMELMLHLFKDQLSENMYALLYLTDIDVGKRRELLQEKAAESDPLTNLLNRRKFEELVKEYMEQNAEEDETCALLITDLDNFKGVNDTYGHQAGDEMLTKFAEILRKTFRTTDYLGRFGGDEFMIFIKKCRSEENLKSRLEELVLQFNSQEYLFSGCSMGVDLFTRDNFRYERNLKHADEALYRAKKNGKQQIFFWNEE